jgi:D-inositol-3-phosphate glycosyltransferase
MDIAIISEHASPIGALGGTDAGGQNVYVAQLAKNLSKLGHKVEVFTRWETPDTPVIQDLSEGFRLVNVPAGPARPVAKENILPLMSEFTEFMIDYIQARRKKFDMIHANFFMSGIVAADLKELLQIPFIITFHALGKIRKIHQKDKDAFPVERGELEERVVRESDRIIAECPQDLEDLLTYYEADIEKIDIIPCGFDSNEMFPVDKAASRMALGLHPSEKIVLHVGRMVPRKGADNVILGFARYIRARKEKNIRLIIVGGESIKPDPKETPEIGRLMEIAKEEGVSERVLFTGSRSRQKLKTYYSAADVFVTTPWYEPFGITPVEAMACGTPVIGSDVGGIKFSIGHGETGLLIPPQDPAALEQALAMILDNEELRLRYGKRSIERVNRLFRWDMMAKQIEEVMETKVLRLNPGLHVQESVLIFQAAEASIKRSIASI